MALPSDDVSPETPISPQTMTRMPASTRQEGSSGASGSNRASHVVTAYVVESGGPCNRYHWDPDTGVPVLDRVLHPAEARGVDLARVPLLPPSRAHGTSPGRRATWIEPLLDDPANELIAGLGPSLLVLVVAYLSSPPGTQLSIRLLGAVRVTAPQTEATGDSTGANAADRVATDRKDGGDDLSEWIAVAVPTADPTLAQVERVDDLPDGPRRRLDDALAALTGVTDVTTAPAAESGTGQHPGAWLSADQVLARLREARASGRLAARTTEAIARGHMRERLYATSDATAGGAGEGDAFRRRLERDAFLPPAQPASTTPPSVQLSTQPSASREAQQDQVTWREIAPVSPAELRARGAAVYGESSQLARWIPARFARYLGELLLPEERVLFFAECPPLTIRGWTASAAQRHGASSESGVGTTGRRSRLRNVGRALDRLRSRHLQSGIFLITDRQALLLRDYAAPDATMVQWGYVAHSMPLARLRAARVMLARASSVPPDDDPLESWLAGVLAGRAYGTAPYDEATVPGQFARIVLALEGADGIEVTGAAFPPESAPVLERAVAVLERFTPLPGPAGASDRRIRLVHAVEAWKPTSREAAELESLGGLVPPYVSSALEAATRGVLQPGDTVLAQARTPSVQEALAGTAALLALTATRLLIVQYVATHTSQRADGPRSPASPEYPPVEYHEVPLGRCTSVTLQHSLLGCELMCAIPGGTPARDWHVETIHIAFPSTLIVPFRALYNRLRLVLANAPVV